MAQQEDTTMDKLVSLCKRRGFVFPGSEIYGGLANSWDYGPYGAQLKKNIKDHWWKFFVESRDDMVGLDAAIIMNPKVWEASGHAGNFSDILSECKNCHNRIRPDHYFDKETNASFFERLGEIHTAISQGELPGKFATELTMILEDMGKVLNERVECGECGKKNWTIPTRFNLMFIVEMSVRPNDQAIAYLRPETAQAMFINFPILQQTSRRRLPFGVAQIGKAFRNEITPGHFIFRTREFEMMEVEYFIDPNKNQWRGIFEYWKEEMERWMKDVGIDSTKTHATEIPDGERAHYSARTVDFEFDYPFGRKELFGLAYRGDYDIKKHEEASGQELRYLDPETGEKILPHVVEPTFGVERAMLAILLSAYAEETVKESDVRTVLKLKSVLAPVQVAVFPLLKNKPELVSKAREIFDSLKMNFRCEFDDNGNVGKRYRRQDEIGTPYCVTVDFDTLTDGTVTVRDRDTMGQTRVKVEELILALSEKLR